MLRVGSFLAFGLWTTCFVACGAFEIEDSGGFGDGGRAGAGADAGGPDAAVVKQPQGEEHRPEGCGAGDTPAMNAACIDEASGVFVDSAVVAEGNGSKASPFKTIASAVAALDGAGETRHWLYLAKGTYREPIVDDQRSLKFFGGLQHASNSEWSAGAPGDVSFVQPDVGPALVVTNILDSSWFEDLDFTAGAVPSGSLSSVAAMLVTAGAPDRPLVFRRVGFHAGAALGGPPALVVEEPTCGAKGEDAEILAPGSGHSCTCADGTNVSGGDGARLYRSARNGSPAELGGAAGGGSCEDGTSTPGGPGQTAAGEPTIGADADTEGVLSAADWVPKDATPGARGAHGGGGGGGATGKYGAGGGGGSGACGGRGGGAGRGGGGSFGVLGLTAFLDFQREVTITTAGGGNGSVGGRPGDARGGGSGGSQGAPGACGGMNGGQGGAGTAGAAGGGGAGGPSIAVLIRGAVTGSENLTRPRNGALGGEWPGGAQRGRTADIVLVDASGVLPSL